MIKGPLRKKEDLLALNTNVNVMENDLLMHRSWQYIIIKIKNCTHLTATVATPRVSPSCQPKSLIDFDIEKY